MYYRLINQSYFDICAHGVIVEGSGGCAETRTWALQSFHWIIGWYATSINDIRLSNLAILMQHVFNRRNFRISARG